MNMIPRVIPVLLIKNGGLVKSTRFKNHRYIGDPINAVKIFNDKEVDEIIVLDIDASREKRQPNVEAIVNIANEAFMPFSYGGGITSFEEAKSILHSGAEKVVLNQSALLQPKIISEIASYFGSQSVVVSIDVKKNFFGKAVAYNYITGRNTSITTLELARQAQSFGAGEIFLNSVDRDGTYNGYDLSLIEEIAPEMDIPVIACGGAATPNDFKLAIDAGASAVAAGSQFVYHGKLRGILINYPQRNVLEALFSNNS